MGDWLWCKECWRVYLVEDRRLKPEERHQKVLQLPESDLKRELQDDPNRLGCGYEDCEGTWRDVQPYDEARLELDLVPREVNPFRDTVYMPRGKPPSERRFGGKHD